MGLFGIKSSKKKVSSPLSSGQFSYTLSQNSVTSAGVYNSSGVLIRTLWSNLSENSGSYTKTWDGKNNEGASQSAGTYSVKVLINNLSYDRVCTLGNTSTAQYGATKHSYLRGFQQFAIHNNKIYGAVGYVEAGNAHIKMDVSTWNQKTHIREVRDGDIDGEFNHVCTDGTNVYWAGYDSYANQGSNVYSFVLATKVVDDSEYVFTGSGTGIVSSLQMSLAQNPYLKCCGVLTGSSTQIPSGIAVRRDGGVHLFVAHQGLNLIKVYNKSTGVFIRDLSFSAPTRLSIDSAGYLWVCHTSNKVSKYSINNDGTISAAILNIVVTKPLDICATPDASTIAIIDGGTSQQIKGYNAVNGDLLWTMGELGGYVNSPLVSNAKFMFDHPYLTNSSKDAIIRPFITFNSANGDMYVGDPGNMRVLRYNSSRTFQEALMCERMNYNSNYNRTNSSRVTSEYLEFELDTNLNWTLKYNWAGNITAAYIPPFPLDFSHLIENFITLSNGKTYCQINYIEDGIKYAEWVEMNETTGLRFTGVREDAFVFPSIQSNGTKIWAEGDKDSLNQPITFYKALLTGFSGSNPTWGNPTVIRTVNTSSTNALYKAWCHTRYIESDDLIIVFSPNPLNTSNHLEFIKGSSGTSLVKTSKANASNYVGDFPTDGTFDIGNNMGADNQYAGGDVYVAGDLIFWNYKGEFWKNSQVNKWNVYHKNGLMVGQFGITTPQAIALDGLFSPRMAAGNVQSGGAFYKGSDILVIHNDESVHGGAHLWKLSNLSSINEAVTSVNI